MAALLRDSTEFGRRRRRVLAAVCLLVWGAQAQPLFGPLVVSDRWPQCTDLVTWTRDVMRLEGLEDASETAQGKAFFRWLRLFSRMAVGGMIQAYEGAFGKEEYVTDAHKNLFVYGWGYCDTTSRIAEAAWAEFKRDRGAAQRVCVQHAGGGYHTMYRLRLDGRWGAFDPRYGYYLVAQDAADARVLDWQEVGLDENILKNKRYRHRSRPFFEYPGLEWERALLINAAFFESEAQWRRAGAPVECVFADPMYRMGTPFHDMNFRLPRGATIERYWDNTARKFYVPAGSHTRREYPFLASGRFYRVTETMFEGNWVRHDPNYVWAQPYLATVPRGEGYPREMEGGRTIGQAWGRIVYQPDLRGPAARDALTKDTTLVPSPRPPYLRTQGTREGQAVFDFYSPYVLVEGAISGELSGVEEDHLAVEVRTLRAKARRRDEPDVWSAWEAVHRGPGGFRISLGRERFNGRNVSLHGVYRFQVRVTAAANPSRRNPAGIDKFGAELYFENGIMSIPRIFAGTNIVRFKVNDAAAVRAPVRVTYVYQTAAGEKTHVQVLERSDFRGNEASYRLEAPGLQRCKSLSIRY
ncbi:MAG TPA: hypothetical protein VNJ11_05785 [Bryobacteraceae bacterium]|nr:hypothetical protein [Bryobacteraceae bacterium]